MISGDIVALYSGDFRLAVAIDNHNLTVIYRLKTIDYKSICNLLNNLSNLKSISSTEILPRDNFEIYKTNILLTPKQMGKTTEQYFDFLILNLKKMHTFTEGDILKMEGLQLMKYTLYNHHAIFSGISLYSVILLKYLVKYLFCIS